MSRQPTFTDAIAFARFDALDEGMLDSIRGSVDSAVARVAALFRSGGEAALRQRAGEMVRDSKGRFKPRAAAEPPEASAGGVLSRLWSRVLDMVSVAGRRVWTTLQTDINPTNLHRNTPVTSEAAEVLFVGVILGELILLGLLPIFGPVVLVLFDRFVLPILLWVSETATSAVAAIPGVAADVAKGAWDAAAWGVDTAWGVGQGMADIATGAPGIPTAMKAAYVPILAQSAVPAVGLSFAEVAAGGFSVDVALGLDEKSSFAWFRKGARGKSGEKFDPEGRETRFDIGGALGGLSRKILGTVSPRLAADSYIKGKLLQPIKRAEIVAQILIDFAGGADDAKMRANWKLAQAWRKGSEQMPKLSSSDAREVDGSEVAEWFEAVLFAESAKRLAINWDYFKKTYLVKLLDPSDTSQDAKEVRERVGRADESIDSIFGIFEKMRDVRERYKGRGGEGGKIPRAAVGVLGKELGDSLNILQTVVDDIEDYF